MHQLVAVSVIFMASHALGKGFGDELVPFAADTNPTCQTISGRECVFPFQYNGNEYYECTHDDSKDGAAWCPTKVDKYGKAISSSHEACDPSVCNVKEACLTESGPDKGNSCKFPFTFNGKTYHSCARWEWDDNDYGKYWCSTRVDKNNVHVNNRGFYGFCGFCDNPACGCGAGACNTITLDDTVNVDDFDIRNIGNFDV